MSTLTQFARARAAERVAKVNEQRESVMRDAAAEDPVHDFRVALRRMEQIFEIFDVEPLGFDAVTAQRQMQEWLRAAGRVRDCDVVLPLLRPPWTNDLHALRRERARELVETLGAGYAMSAPHVRRVIKPSEEVVQFARIVLPRQAKEYFGAGARAAKKKPSLGRLHEFRLHGKSIRYSLELFEPLYGPRMKLLEKILKRTQQLLGEMADARAGLKLLKQLNAPEAVLEPLHGLANEKREAFAKRWFEEVPDENVATKWVEYLRRYPTVRVQP